MNGRRTLVVVGHGMVGHKLVQALVERDAGRDWDIVVFGEEPHVAYDRVHLSALFDGASARDLSLVELDDPAVRVRSDDRVAAVDRGSRTVTTQQGRVQAYDALVLATGSIPFVPPIPGRGLPGCFVYRTIDDVEAIRTWAGRAARGVVVGGGLLGLEAANALRCCGLDTHVIEFASRLMPAQVDEAGGVVLQGHIEALGVAVRTATTVAAVEAGPTGQVASVTLRTVGGDGVGERFETDMVVFSAGIRPRDDLARTCGLELGERGGVVIDAQCRTSDPSIFAIGECASVAGRVYGLVAPGYQMARTVADTLSGRDAAFVGADMSTKLKLLGVDVASFGDAHAATGGAATIDYTDHPGRIHKRLVVGADGRLLGGVMVGDASGYETLAQMARGEIPTPVRPAALITPTGGGAAVAVGMDALPDTATVCSCENVTKGAIRAAVASCVAETGDANVAWVKKACRAGTGCGGCVPQLTDLVKAELTRAGVAVDDHLCEHFPHSRQELFDIVRRGAVASFAALLASHGRGKGCEICKPAVASILASIGNRYVLDVDQAGLQDSNDHFLANLQRDGTYSVVPRIPGGEITPDKLIVLGEVARDFRLYTKITGGQRIDLLGARVEQLPAIWGRLVDAGFESGHAYGKALRTVKSCVGTAWCRYGIQDSTTLAIDLELRYRGLRSPHKVKMGVSGCARECAEAQSKDVGVIATERGWNLYVCGNGGTRPRHADLLAEDLDTKTLVRTIDRFLMYYIRTADRLQRSAAWLEQLDGGIEHLRRVLLDDTLGLGGELDAHMERHIASYVCEWKATLDSPERLARFRAFVNSDDPDPGIVFVTERDQPRPAQEWEKVHLVRSSI
jgi:nitrite reductase (NADH) large subunit